MTNGIPNHKRPIRALSGDDDYNQDAPTPKRHAQNLPKVTVMEAIEWVENERQSVLEKKTRALEKWEHGDGNTLPNI
jgi:hypothetical protein